MPVTIPAVEASRPEELTRTATELRLEGIGSGISDRQPASHPRRLADRMAGARLRRGDRKGKAHPAANATDPGHLEPGTDRPAARWQPTHPDTDQRAANSQRVVRPGMADSVGRCGVRTARKPHRSVRQGQSGQRHEDPAAGGDELRDRQDAVGRFRHRRPCSEPESSRRRRGAGWCARKVRRRRGSST